MLARPIADGFHAHGALNDVWGADLPEGMSHVPSAHEMIDPLKDTIALIAQVRAGYVPQPKAVGAFSNDFGQVVEMIREANVLLGDAVLSLDTDPRRVTKSGDAQPAPSRAPPWAQPRRSPSLCRQMEMASPSEGPSQRYR